MITRTGFARRTLITFLAGALVLMAAPPSADASPFMLNLLGSSGGGGGGASGPVGSAGFGMGGTSTVSIPGVTVRGLGLQLTSNRIVDPTRLGGPDGPSNVQQIVTPAQLASTTGFGLMSLGETSRLVLTVVKPITDAAIANLNLGDGEYLAVSETVAHSLIENVPGDVPARNGNGEHIIGSGAPAGSVGTNAVDHDAGVANGTSGSLPSGASASNPPASPNADANVTTTVRAILSDIAVDIISYPSEVTGRLSGSVLPSAALASAPEPASLLLLGSGLALGARFVRRRKHPLRQSS